jgi:hypothetical protein
MKKAALPLLLGCLLLFTGFWLEHADSLKPLKEELQKKEVATSDLGMNKFREQARFMGLFEIAPNKNADYSLDPQAVLQKKSRYLPNNKARRGAVSYSVKGNLSPEQYPSASFVPKEEIESQTPILSIAADNSDLFDPALGIFTNPSEKGKKWERPSFVSYFENGKLQFSSGAGLRLHGGKSRLSDLKSLRLRFRSLYGEPSIDGKFFFPGYSGQLQSLVLQIDKRFSHSLMQYGHFMSPLAYDLVRIIGGKSPLTKPVRFYLNGKFMGAYVLTERIDEDYLQTHFGHKNFLLATEKNEDGEDRIKHGSHKRYRRFSKWVKRLKKPSLHEVSRVIDLENFSLSLIASLFTATTDSYQAYMVKDERHASHPWFWINWDMDHAFVDVYRAAKYPWRHPTLSGMLVPSDLNKNALRFTLFKKMKRQVPGFQEYFRKLVAEVLNHRLRPDILEERASYYCELGDELGVRHTRYKRVFKEFMRHRPLEVFKQVAGRFSDGHFFAVHVKLPADEQVKIDGYAWKHSYTGRYFNGMSVQLETEPAVHGQWIVDGVSHPIDKKPLILPVQKDMNIRLQTF